MEVSVKREKEMELEHIIISHEHPLILKKEENDGKYHWCNGCWEEIRIMDGPFYRCSSSLECDFKLHKYCGELPKEIQHPLHKEHPLTLFAEPPNPSKSCICNGCDVDEWEYFTYHCSLCQFNLDVLCATPITRKMEHPSHKHPLIPLMKPASFTNCDACNTNHEGEQGIFYTCPTCIQVRSQLFIHQDCLSLPLTLKHTFSDHHDHNLSLAFSIPPDYSLYDPCCQICSEELDSEYWVYYCGGCRYFAHVNCAITTKTAVKIKKKIPEIGPFIFIHDPELGPPIPEPKPSMFNLITEPCCEADEKDEDLVLESIQLPVPETVSLVSHFLKNMKLEATQRDHKTIELNHFSHKHPLTFFDVQREDEELCYSTKLSLVNEMKDGEICSGCIQQISNSPFYSCAQCNFFLHDCCAKLPTTLQHPCHPQHSLILIAKASTSLDLFFCECCKFYCNGFAYHCANCNFYLDVKCGLLPSAIRHEAHPGHLLQLREQFDLTRCKSCEIRCFDMFAFECNTCNFKLLIGCVLLPRTIRQKYDNLHLFTLTYSPIKCHQQEYICEVCEKEFDPMRWFYHCVDCDKSIHVSCTLAADEYCNVKFGGISKIDLHEHPVTLVQKTKKPSMCDLCGEKIRCDFVFDADSTLECSQCHFKLHLKCALQK